MTGDNRLTFLYASEVPYESKSATITVQLPFANISQTLDVVDRAISYASPPIPQRNALLYELTIQDGLRIAQLRHVDELHELLSQPHKTLPDFFVASSPDQLEQLEYLSHSQESPNLVTIGAGYNIPSQRIMRECVGVVSETKSIKDGQSTPPLSVVSSMSNVNRVIQTLQGSLKNEEMIEAHRKHVENVVSDVTNLNQEELSLEKQKLYDQLFSTMNLENDEKVDDVLKTHRELHTLHVMPVFHALSGKDKFVGEVINSLTRLNDIIKRISDNQALIEGLIAIFTVAWKDLESELDQLVQTSQRVFNKSTSMVSRGRGGVLRKSTTLTSADPPILDLKEKTVITSLVRDMVAALCQMGTIQVWWKFKHAFTAQDFLELWKLIGGKRSILKDLFTRMSERGSDFRAAIDRLATLIQKHGCSKGREVIHENIQTEKQCETCFQPVKEAFCIEDTSCKRLCHVHCWLIAESFDIADSAEQCKRVVFISKEDRLSVPPSHLVAHQLNLMEGRSGTRVVTLPDGRKAVMSTNENIPTGKATETPATMITSPSEDDQFSLSSSGVGSKSPSVISPTSIQTPSSHKSHSQPRFMSMTTTSQRRTATERSIPRIHKQMSGPRRFAASIETPWRG